MCVYVKRRCFIFAKFRWNRPPSQEQSDKEHTRSPNSLLLQIVGRRAVPFVHDGLCSQRPPLLIFAMSKHLGGLFLGASLSRAFGFCISLAIVRWRCIDVRITYVLREPLKQTDTHTTTHVHAHK